MPNEKEVDNMPIWQDHERRITTLETTFASMSHEMKDVKAAVEKTGNEQKAAVEKMGDEQKHLLNKLIEHHLATNKLKLNNFWKLLIAVFGGGSFLYVLYDLIVRISGG